MNIQEIITSLTEAFNEPLGDGETRKIIYWIDREQSFIDIFEEINIVGIKKHVLKENNYFYTKYLLEEEDTEANYLIYTNETLENDGENWLLDNVLYSKKFFADEVSIHMRDLGIPEEWRGTVSENRKFFRSKERYAKFKSFAIEKYSDEIIEIAIISALCNQKSPDFEEALRTIMMDTIEDENNKYLEKIAKFFDINRFWYYVEKNYGFKQENRTLKKLLIHLMITNLSFDVSEDKLSNYKEFISESNKSNCYNFINRWMNHKSDYEIYDKYADKIEKEIAFGSVLGDIHIDEIKNADVFPFIDKAIIMYILNGLNNRIEDFEAYIKLIRLRRTKHFYEKFRSIYEALYNTVKMFEFKKNHNNTLILTSASNMLEAYTKDYYQMDLFYRKFYVAYDENSSSEILKKLKVMVEDLYTNWFMVELSHNWTSALANDVRNHWKITGVRNQRDFYDLIVKPKVNSNDKVYVIISDALRYEVATELCERLNTESLGSVELTPMLSGLPSITKLGMANLLPHEKIEINDKGNIIIDGINSSSIEGRNRILTTYVTESAAIDYKDFMVMNRSRLREFSKGKKLIYIYHDSIDALGDKASTEIYAFDGAEKALNELSELIKVIRDSLSGTNIFITSDHGFIYQRDELEEVDKISKEKLDFVESKRRYALSREARDVDGLLRYSIKEAFSEETDLNVYIPKANIRFKTQGAGAKFVHGGASLQEVVIPLILYKNKRAGQSSAKAPEKTQIKLTNAVRKITNSIFTLNFFQTEKVEGKTIPCSVNVYFVDENDQVISNEEVIFGDKTSNNPDDRNVSIRFVLKSMDYDKNKKYYLIIKDTETNVICDKIPFIISLGIVSDFDF
jgi:uncharacterized protein (TIGR02687 family)